MKKVILLFILFMLPSTSVFAASSVVAIKEKEIELNKQKNKELNVNLFAVTTGISYEYILRGLYNGVC